MQTVPTRAKRDNRALTRDEMLKLVASVAYAFMGRWFETFSITHAVFS